MQNTTLDPKKIRYAIIKHRGDPKHATRDDGVEVYRSEKIFVKENNEFVPCAQYDNHFVYEDKRPWHWAHMCTCGSPAVIVGTNVYKKDASPTASGKLFVCFHHANNGKHADGSS